MHAMLPQARTEEDWLLPIIINRIKQYISLISILLV